jgi:hypothetical protein
MADLIDRDKLLEDVQISATVSGPRSIAKEVGQAILDVSNYIINIIKKEPTADIELRAHWIIVGGDLGHVDCKCSACGHTDCFDDESGFYNYCPECGCKMDKAFRRCGDCAFSTIDAKILLTKMKSFPEVDGCGNFKRKEE